jgi:hypothetical protein
MIAELDAQIALDRGERVVLANGEDHVVARRDYGIERPDRQISVGVTIS